MGGHVFVTIGSAPGRLRRLAPSRIDSIGRITGAWRRRVPDGSGSTTSGACGISPTHGRSRRCGGPPLVPGASEVDGRSVERHKSQAWAANIGSFDADIGRYLRGLGGSSPGGERPPAFGRDRPLLPVPHWSGPGRVAVPVRARQIARALLGSDRRDPRAGAHA